MPDFSHFRQAVIDFMIKGGKKKRRKRYDMTFYDSILNAYDWSKIGNVNYTYLSDFTYRACRIIISIQQIFHNSLHQMTTITVIITYLPKSLVVHPKKSMRQHVLKWEIY